MPIPCKGHKDITCCQQQYGLDQRRHGLASPAQSYRKTDAAQCNRFFAVEKLFLIALVT